MNFFLILLIILFAIILAILIIALYIVHKVKKSVGSAGWNEFKNAAQNSKAIREEFLRKEKSVVGMTKLVLPRILEDHNDFSEQMLYNKVEADLNNIFNAYENKKHVNSEDLYLIQDNINAKVDDLVSRNVDVKYDDVVFHQHAIKSYRKFNGVSKIQTSSTVEYYYKSDKKNEFENIKRQTRYTCEYVYIYDYSKIKNVSKQKLFILNCPNCGAPLYDLHNGNCKYCMSQIGQEKLKIWKMSSYKEDYQNSY